MWRRHGPGVTVVTMDARLAAVAAARGGVFSAADAARCGAGSSVLERMVRAGELVRVRRGAYIVQEVWAAADRDERHRLTTRAILRTRPPGDAASHHAAVLLHGIDTWGVDLGVVDVVSSVRSVRRRGSLRTHPRAVRRTELVDGAPTVPLPLALVQLAAWSGLVPGVVSLDDALHDERCSREELNAAVCRLPEHEQVDARAALDLADALTESAGETRTRLLLLDLGFRVRSQVTVRLPDGRRARVDLVVDDVVAVEFDGLVKYAGVDGKHALAAEKHRERGLWDLGYEIERVVWRDLDAPRRLEHRVLAARARALSRQPIRRSSRDTGEHPGAAGASA